MTFPRFQHRLTGTINALLLAVFLSVFTGCFSVSAEAAGSYNVRHYTLDSIDYYQVYQNYSELDETPTFISTSWDKYESTNYENGVRITFFRSYNLKSNDQADALCQYLANHSSAARCYANWYSMNSTQYGYTESVTMVYLVEGLNRNTTYYLEYLWDWNPFLNMYGTTLNLEYGSDEDQWNSFSTLWNWGCSAVLTIHSDDGERMSYGMIFRDGVDQHIVRRCCVYESWD